MTEVHTGRPETQQPKSNVIDFEAARQKRQAEQKSQIRRTLTPLPTQADREERHTVKLQKHIKEELAHFAHQPTDGQAQQQAAQTQQDDKLVNELFGGQSEEQIAAHNEQIKARREKEQAEKEKVREEALKQYKKYQEYLAAMTPEEREEREREHERLRTEFNQLTPEKWKQLMHKMHATVKAMEREKAAWIAERDPRYDPMTGDLLAPDEFPLSPTSEYYFDGKTRGRRFIPPDSPHLKAYKPLQIDEGEEQVPESEYHERLVQRLQKAGFVEVEPSASDQQFFALCERLRNMTPEEIIKDWQETQREMRERLGIDERTALEKFGDFLVQLLDLLMRLLLDLPVVQEEKENSAQPT